jgi:hypothetical protein
MSGVSRLFRLRNSKGFTHVYTEDTKQIDDDAYLVSTDDDEKKKFELNDKAYQLYVIVSLGLHLGL